MDGKELTETLRNTIGDMDPETLKSTLAYVLKVYVIDKDLSYDGNVRDTAGGGGPSLGLNIEPPKNFTELMLEVKRQYQMQELRFFTVENGLVYITLNNTRYQVSVETATDRQTAPLPTGFALEPEAGNKQPNSGQPNPNNGTLAPQRFKNLEMDD